MSRPSLVTFGRTVVITPSTNESSQLCWVSEIQHVIRIGGEIAKDYSEIRSTRFVVNSQFKVSWVFSCVPIQQPTISIIRY